VSNENAPSLSSKAFSSGKWMFSLRFIDKGLRTIRKIILARLLAPNDFGLFGIALLMLSSMEAFTKTGFDAAIIQKQDDIGEYLDTAWIIQVVRGLLLAIILFIFAPVIAGFFDENLAIPILRVLSLAEIFKGLKSIGVVLFQKELDFKKRFIYVLSGTFFDLLVGIPAAFILRNAWALVIGVLTGHFVRFVVSFILHPFRPKLNFDLNKAKEMFDFGKWQLAASIITFTALHLDDFTVGRLLGAAALGFFQMAFHMSNITATEITHVISKVTFPLYSKVQENNNKLKKIYKMTFELIISIAFPMVAGMIILAPLGIKIVLGEDWLPMVYAFQILAVGGIFRTIAATGASVFYAIGYPKGDFILNKWRFIILTIGIFPLTYYYGLEGASLASGLALASTMVPLFKMLKENIFLTFKEILIISEVPFFSTLIMSFSVFLLYINLANTIFSLIIIMLFGMIIYFVSIYAFYKFKDKGPFSLAKWVLNNVK